MNEQEVEKLLQKISNQKMFGETEKAIANLHILNNEFPEEKKYLALLGSAYYDADSIDTAEDYCRKALEKDPDYPEAFELQGMIAEKRGNDELAEKYYKESISKNQPFKMGYLRLVLLYYKLERYDDAIKEAEYLLANFDTGRNEYSQDEQRKIFGQWLSFAYNRLYSSLIRTNQYEKAAEKINEFVAFRSHYVSDPYQFLSEDEILFKLYHALNDSEKMKELEAKMLTFYMVPQEMVDSMKKDAEQGYFESANPENYKV
ncbi:tetratricopeptide repeat protein [Chryseobacterium timonianum]|uniref:tetratricopeptide repeat protein n=1 Tax=Chryseobacterium timonianum TaxID=1805473 RepID=UPI001F4B2D08|nr:tetratricopeptide repeat protein [Chryseobacterium timonianum]